MVHFAVNELKKCARDGFHVTRMVIDNVEVEAMYFNASNDFYATKKTKIQKVGNPSYIKLLG